MESTQEIVQLAARVALARRDFMEFCCLVDPSYRRAKHLDYLARRLEALEAGEVRRLLILMPPRSGKSYTVSQLFPAWLLGRHPSWHVILTAHTDRLAESFSLAVRNVIEHGRLYREVFPGVYISNAQQAASRWALHGHQDTMIAAGIGSGITGYGANCLVGSTLVTTKRGTVSLEELEVGDQVMARSGGSLVFDVVKAVRVRRHSGRLVRLRVRGWNSLEGTPDHLVYLPREGAYVPMEYMEPGMEVLCVDGIRQVEDVEWQDVRDVDVYDIQTRGNFFASGVLVHNCLIIDDPVKNYEEAVSEVVQERNWRWYTTTARTRLVADGRVLVVMTHWSEGDLAGRILDSPEGKDFQVIAMPAQSLGTWEDATPEFLESLDPFSRRYVFPDVLGRRRGEPLWPEMGFDDEFLETARAVLGHEYQGLYQCSPTVPQGVVFRKDHFKAIVQAALEGAQPVLTVRSYDLAFSASQRADNTVALKVSLWQLDDGVAVVVEDCQVWQEEWDRTAERIVAIARQDGEAVRILVEAVASQNLAFKSLRRDPRLARYSVVAVVPDKDKVARAQYALRLTAMGIVRILYPNASTPPPWEEEFLVELASFPHGLRDDRVDAFTQAINHLQPQIDALLARPKQQASAPVVRQPELPWVFRDVSFGGFMRDMLGWRKG